ncbi:hypothetical protein M011DRAFT_476135 [Sporormia fimetaria CBS 119925]|uniref:Diaminohydroxyphosphoribosylamino-pyrimidine deaminase n=1 Tax=Sporormia fimetaria CBS 119925 TaxID=1340428 RepID=A0A6A6VDR1_9PLEO|nr:hypothetical protein M011DRAFT_476135 [Sporormia fimetaria CBS 119925]
MDLNSVLKDPVTDPAADAFVLFSQELPSQLSLGFIDARTPSIEVTVAGRDLTIHHSRGLLSSDRKGGTTGAVVWKVTPLFAEWVASQNFLSAAGYISSDAVVLELGAGVSGIVAVTLAPLVHKYIATDQDYVLRILKQNIAENLPVKRPSARGASKSKRSTPVSQHTPASVETLELDWEVDSVSSLPSRTGVGNGFDLIIACDCVYNEALIEPLNSTCAQVCKLRSDSHGKPTLCLVAQQLRSYDVFETWLESFDGLFHVWQVPPKLLTQELDENSGFVVHVGMVR